MAVSYGHNQEYSAAYKLFNMHWLCIVPANEVMDENDFELFGLALSDNPEWNARLATAPKEHMLSPADMAQLMADGVDVTLRDPEDAVPIYKLVIEHLTDWRDFLADNTLYDVDVPLEGLKEFNQLAAALVPVGRRFGLVDKMVEKKHVNPNKFERAHSIGTKKILQAKNARHSDMIFNDIAYEAGRRGQRISWRPTHVEKESDYYHGSI